MRVQEIWRYPVKSIGGEQLDEVAVTGHGFEGDRAFGIVDDATGYVLTARRAPELLQGRARWLQDDPDTATASVRIEVAGEALVDDGMLSEWLGRSVRLLRAGTEGGTFENPRDVDNESDWQTWTGPAQAWHDSTRTRVSLVSTATLGDWDGRRFRANVVLDGGEVAGDEDRFVGTIVSLGEVRLEITKRIDRCIMVTRPQPGVERDREVLRTIHRDRNGCLAIGALVQSTGVVRVGDTIREA